MSDSLWCSPFLQAGILEWVAFAFSRGFSQPRDRTQVSRIAGGFFTMSHKGSPILMESESEVAQSCPTLCDPMDCSLSGSSVQETFQAIVLEWIAISFSRELPDPGIEPGLPHCRQMLNHLSHQGSKKN